MYVSEPSVFSCGFSRVSKFTWPCPKSTSPCYNPVTMRFRRLNSLRIFGERFDTIMETQRANRHCYAMVESIKKFGIVPQVASYERFLIPVLTEGATPTLVGMAKRFVTRRVGTTL